MIQRSHKSLVGLSLAIASLLAIAKQTDATGPFGVGHHLARSASHAVEDLAGGAMAAGLGGLSSLAAAGLGGGPSAMSAARAGATGAAGLANVLNAAGNVVNGAARPLLGLHGSLSGALNTQGNLIGDKMRMIGGIASGAAGAAKLGALGGLGGAALAGLPGAVGAAAGAAGGLAQHHSAYRGGQAALAGAIEGGALELGAQMGASGAEAAGLGAVIPAAGAGAAAAAADGIIGGLVGAAGAAGLAGAAPGLLVPGVVPSVSSGVIGPVLEGVATAANAAAVGQAGAQLAVNQLGRAGLANEAMRNTQAESAIAGADMVAHGANNARSASLASNAYRQAKLASARDRVNIAGTIQNSARISDAAIASHDTATKAEDSLLGSEIAVDSASTALDSDGAYIPPVTSSLLRSLPYGRLGIRNIVPKPLTYPSTLLPDVWLNGVPVNYLNVPLRMLPFTIGPTPVTNPLWASSSALAHGQIVHGQPFIANNGLLLNGMVVDPAVAYMATGAAGIAGLAGSSILPVLANGQLEALDEVAIANLIAMQQLASPGMSATYQGYARLNPVPMITGTVSDANLLPTTTVGTTYPIGSALVIEPRDSFFQDYVDNASSRQNNDERSQ